MRGRGRARGRGRGRGWGRVRGKGHLARVEQVGRHDQPAHARVLRVLVQPLGLG